MDNIGFKRGFSLSQASKELGLNIKTVNRWARKGLIDTTVLPSGRRVISREQVDNLKELLSGKVST